MDGALVPAAAFAWDPLLHDLLENPVTVQWVHRVLGTALTITIIAFHFYVRRLRLADRAIRAMSAGLIALVLGQYLLGVLTVVLHVPPGIAVAHQALAMALFGTWLVLLHRVSAAWHPVAPALHRVTAPTGNRVIHVTAPARATPVL
jgi:cytochrome c oxidase assembly protein subunit 15